MRVVCLRPGHDWENRNMIGYHFFYVTDTILYSNVNIKITWRYILRYAIAIRTQKVDFSFIRVSDSTDICAYIVESENIWAASWQNQQNDMCTHRPVWSKSSLSAWRKIVSLATLGAHSEDSDQTWRMPRLIWVFARCTCRFVDFVMKLLNFSFLQVPFLSICFSCTAIVLVYQTE